MLHPAFGLAKPLRVFCDVSLRAFAEVFPAGGTPDTAVCITPDLMAQLTEAQWVDVTISVAEDWTEKPVA